MSIKLLVSTFEFAGFFLRACALRSWTTNLKTLVQRFSGCLSVQVELCFAHAYMAAFTRHNIHEL